MKVLVLGSLAGKVKDYQMVAKKMDINPDNVEFVDTYDDKRYNLTFDKKEENVLLNLQIKEFLNIFRFKKIIIEVQV